MHIAIHVLEAIALLSLIGFAALLWQLRPRRCAMTAKVTVHNKPDMSGRNVKLTVSSYGGGRVKILEPGATVEELVHQEQSILLEEG